MVVGDEGVGGVGWVLLLVQKVLRYKIDRSNRYICSEYEVVY